MVIGLCDRMVRHAIAKPRRCPLKKCTARATDPALQRTEGQLGLDRAPAIAEQ
jgi:hypothetical protein